MPVFNSAFPIITTPDLARALTFYRDGLGGTVVYQFPPDDPVFVAVRVGSSEIGLAQNVAVAASDPSPRFAMWIYADDCDAAIARLRQLGVAVVAAPTNQPWGERVARVHDPDGNLVFIGSVART